MTAQQLCHWLRSLHPVPEPSVDLIVVGRPETVVTGMAVAWMPTLAALADAVAHGCNVFVAHEPTFYSHLDMAESAEGLAALGPRAAETLTSAREAKRAWIEQHGLVVIRCHDVLDAMPGGVADSLAAAVSHGPADYAAQSSHQRVLRLREPVAAGELAQRIADALVPVAQPGVAFYGDPSRVVRTLGLGTGYASHPWDTAARGAEMAITIDDRIKTWTEASWADDTGYPLAVIHHGASEEWGVRKLGALLQREFPDVHVHPIAQGCTARWFPARAATGGRERFNRP